MFFSNAGIRLILLSLFFIQVTTQDSDDRMLRLVMKQIMDNFFSLWTWPCSEWVKIFSEDAIWYHPKFPNSIEYNQLIDFCEVNQKTRPALFRQDGQIRLAISGNGTYSPLYHLMVPYLYGQIQDENPDSLFINRGYEYILVTQNDQNLFRIKEVVEFFNRASLPFVWPPNN